MKKAFFLLLLLPVFAMAQDKGMHFEHGLSWAEVQAKAKAENKYIFMDCFTTWCGPCKMMAPILESVKKQVGDTVTIIKIDVDKNPEAAGAYRVQGVPTLILFREGKILWRQSGVVQANQLQQVINQHSNNA